MARDGAAYERFCDTVDGPLLVLAVLWLPVLIIPIAAKPSPALADALDALDYFVWAVFVVEYLVKFALAPNRVRFVRTHLVDLLIVAVPFLRPLRIARLLRLLRLIRVATVLIQVLRRAKAILTHKGLNFVLLAVLIIVGACSALEYVFEANHPGSNIHDFGDALWWSVVTVTTVGYGDRYPVTAAGRGVAVVLMLVGIGLVGVVTASVASYFVEQGQDESNQEVQERLERIEVLLGQLLTERRSTVVDLRGAGEPVSSDGDGVTTAG